LIKKFNNILVVTGIGDYSSADMRSVLTCRDAVIESIRASGRNAESLEIHENAFFGSHKDIIKNIREICPDCVFNLFEGFVGRSGSEADFARMLENENIPFTGNGSSALETCLDKPKTKKILDASGIKTPKGVLVRDLSEARWQEICFPAFVKPAFEDASVGIDDKSLAQNPEMLRASLEEKLPAFPGGLLVEEFLPGKEFNAAFLGDYPYENLGVSLMDYELYSDCPNYMGFSAKWYESTVEYKKLFPSVSDRKNPEYRSDVVEISRRSAMALGCSRYFRVDLREKNGELYVLDVNPNPDISPGSGLIRQAASRGMSYSDVISRILENVSGT
jgi:D-alanine-D-alanine ligase